jgi:RNA polymerase sigma-70 factor (ECF subfamily)
MALMDRLRRRPSPEEVVKAHGPHVARLLWRLFGPSADIDDVYQAVFVEVLRSLPAFEGRAKLSTWIHRITLNVAYQEMRLQCRERASRVGDALEHATADLCQPGDDFARADSRRLLYAGLAALDAKKRIAVVLHDVEGYTLKEISEHLGRPLQTVASQVRTGRAELARFVAEAESATEVAAPVQLRGVIS